MELTWGLVVNALLGLGAIAIVIWELKGGPYEVGIVNRIIWKMTWPTELTFYLFTLVVVGIAEVLAYLIWLAIARSVGPPPEHLFFCLIGVIIGGLIIAICKRVESRRFKHATPSVAEVRSPRPHDYGGGSDEPDFH